MNAIYIEGTSSTPTISCDVETGTLSMTGDSYPENSFEFFNDVIEWVSDFVEQQDKPLTLELKLIYMNTSSVKAMMDIFDLLEAAHLQGYSVAVNWYYDPRNERVIELAEEFKEDCTFSFMIIPEER
ncbi:biofilm regulation phosphoprotein SiaC [Nitrincola sp. MINF-07-Sa-05]|uniref:biofilm regulation phosphoprotein SiaC n=1 Tax=Nitrincola salilacus TaxID=3400273 RepID=UPI003917DCB7